MEHRGLYFRDKVAMAIVTVFIIVFFIDLMVNLYFVLPTITLPSPIVDLITTDKNLPYEARDYALSDFIITRKVSGRVRVIWRAPEQLNSSEYLRLNIVFYLVSFIAIPMLVANINIGKVLKDNVIEYAKSVVVPLLLTGILSINRLFGSIGYYYAKLVFTKLDITPQEEYAKALALYFLSQYSEKWIIIFGFIGLATLFILRSVRRDTIPGMLSEALNFIVLNAFYFSSYVLIAHMVLFREHLFNYFLIFIAMLLPIIRMLLVIKAPEGV